MVKPDMNQINAFLDEIVWLEDWFQVINQKNAWDLFVLAGSYVRGDATNESDIDLFLVLPHAIQQLHKISPVHIYTYKGQTYEISKVASEKLEQSVLDKRNLYWWHKTHLVRSNNRALEKQLTLAACVTSEDIRTLLWNNYCLYELTRENNLQATMLANNDVGSSICFHSCIDLLVESELMYRQIFVSNKKKGQYLRLHNPILYEKIAQISARTVPRDYAVELVNLKSVLVERLLEVGFSEHEIESWDKHNLGQFLYQVY